MKGRSSHESLIEGLIDYFTQRQIEIYYANYSGYKKPMAVKRHTPDMLCVDSKTGMAYISEAKVCSELTDQITKEQFEDFPKRIIKNGKSAGKYMQFCIAVPLECETKIKEAFRQWNIPWRDNIQILGFKK